jgi:hypothetical protein
MLALGLKSVLVGYIVNSISHPVGPYVGIGTPHCKTLVFTSDIPHFAALIMPGAVTGFETENQIVSGNTGEMCTSYPYWYRPKPGLSL